MTLRRKTLLIITVLMMGLIVVLYAVSYSVLSHSFAELEEEDTTENVERVVNYLSEQVSQLDSTTSDWAGWDDTYTFVQDANQEFIDSNLADSTFSNLGLNIMLFVDTSGRIVQGKAFDLENEQEIAVPQGWDEYISANGFLVSHTETEGSVSGLLLLPEGPVLVASRPIITSEREGPIRGALIMGRYLDSVEVSRLSAKTRLSLTVQRLDDLQMPAEFDVARSALGEDGGVFVKPLDAGSVAGYTFLEDIQGKPALVLKVEMARAIYQHGQTSLLLFMSLLVVAGVLFVVAVLLVLGKWVLTPLFQLSASVSSIGVRGDPSARVVVKGRDEMASLGGEINRMLGALQEAQQAQRESELVARTVIEGMADGVMLVDMEGKITYVNKAFEGLLGHQAEEVVGTSALELPTYRDSRDKARAREALKGVIEKVSAKAVEMIAITKDGKEVPISFTASVIEDAQGKPKTLVGVLRDVTERRWAEEALRKSEEYYKSLLENSLDAITILNEDGSIRYESPSYERLLGFKPEEKVGSNLFERIHPDDITRVAELFADFLQNRGGTIHTEVRAQHKDDSWHSIEAIGSNLLDNPVVKGIVVNLRDITGRKRAESELRLSEERYRLVVETAGEAILVAQDGMLKFFNPKVMEILGYSREELASKPFIELVHPEDQSMVVERYMARLRGEEVPPVYYFKVVAKGGDIRWAEIRAVLFTWEGRPATLNFLTDITERKEADEAVRKSEGKLRFYLDNSPDAIYISDVKANFLYGNRAAERLVGYPREELLGKNFLELGILSEENVLKAAQLLERNFVGEPTGPDEFELIRKDGARVFVEISTYPTGEGDKMEIIGIARDITVRRSMEEQLRLASRLAAVGELSAGVAHELNNPIAAIQGYAQFLASRKDLEEGIRKDADIIYREAQRAAKITKNLLSFARRNEPEKTYISLNEVLEKTLELRVHQTEESKMEVVPELAPDLPKTMADFYQMQHVFTNIVVNAEQAMAEVHGGGRLVVKSEKAGGMIRVSFTDDGPGISEENLKKVFDPFFTTKEVGKGTGLGLSISYGLIENHGGRIYARSKLGEGTTFIVEIPIASDGQQG